MDRQARGLRRLWRRHWRRLRRDASGITAVEFALVLPVLVITILGTVEFGRLVLLTQKLQNGTFILSDLAARDQTLSEAQVTSIFLAFDSVIEPFDFATSGTAIISSVGIDAAGVPVVNWQRTGAGTLEATSLVGEEAGTAVLPLGLTPTPGETIIVSEVFYAFEPLFGLSAEATTVHKVSYVKPRLGTLATLLP